MIVGTFGALVVLPSLFEVTPITAGMGTAVLICCLGFALNGVYPFGRNSALIIDGVHQYLGFYREFLHQLGEGGGWTYSAHAMGYSFFSLFSYYLSSPFSIVVLLLMQVFYVNEAVTIVVLMKIGLTGLTMAWNATVSRQGVQTGKERRNCGRFSLLCFIKW